MVILFEKKILIDGLSKVMGAIDKKQINPMLQSCFVQVESGKAVFIATDLEVAIEVRKIFDVPVSEKKVFLLPARTVLDFCKALHHAQMIEMHFEKNRIQMCTQFSSLSVASMPADDFPLFDKNAMVLGSFQISKKLFKDLLEKTQYAMALADVRYYLNGLFLQILPDEVIAVGTDGHRLALARKPVQENSFGAEFASRHWILPRRAVLELQRLFEIDHENLTISLTKDTLFVSAQDTIASFKLIEGKYPDYRRVIPKKQPYRVRLAKEIFKEALLTVAPVLSSRDKAVTFFLGEKDIKIKAISAENNEVISVVSLLEGSLSAEIKISFNLNYILDFVNHVKGDELAFSFQDSNSGVVLSCSQEEQYVVMPLIL